MKKELSINLEYVMTSYSYYAFPQCIMTAEDRLGDRIACFTETEQVCDEWKSVGNISCVKEQNQWTVRSRDRYYRDCNGCIYREMKDEDFVSIRVDDQQYTQAWGAVNLFITDTPEKVLLGDNEYKCRFGHFIYDGVSLYIDGKWENIPKEKFQTPYQLVLRREGNRVEAYAGEDRAVCRAVREISFSHNKKWYIGVQVRHEENSFYPWFFSNFIQLSSDVTNLDRRLEFHYGLLKHWNSNSFHYFFDSNQFTAQDICEMGGIKYVRKCLLQGKYIETKLDQFYIEQREEFQTSHHLHQSLLYGFDDGEKCFSVVGYDNKGKLIRTRIKYRDLKKNLNENGNVLFQILTYEEDPYPFRFSPQYVKTMIQEYLDGKNSGERMQHLVPLSERRYGMKLYDELMSEQGLDVLVADRRVAHVLWEHKKIMTERMEYLMEMGVFEDEHGRSFIQKMKNITEMVYDLKNILLKYQIRPDKRNDERIRAYLEEIRDTERMCLSEALDKWKDE